MGSFNIVSFKDKVSKVSKNTIVIAVLVLIIGGYIFFFASPYIFSLPIDNLLYTEMDIEQKIDESHRFTIEDWQYSEEQNRMEVIFSFDNLSYDGVNEYDYSIISRNKGKKNKKVEFDVVYESPSFSALIINDVPKDFYEMAITVSYEEIDLSSVSSGVTVPQKHSRTVYNNIGKVHQVNDITEANIFNLYIDKLNRNINEHKENISSLEGQNAIYQDNLKNITEKAASLRESEMYMTNTQIEETERQIKQLQNSYETTEKLIKDNEEKINDENIDIKEIEDKIEQIKLMQKTNQKQ